MSPSEVLPIWAWALLAIPVLFFVLAAVAWMLIRSQRRKARSLGSRLLRLPSKAKLDLLRALMRDPRIPLALRLIVPALLLYLALPLDLIPDFIPIIGQIDDLIILALALAAIIRFAPLDVIDEHLSQFEADSIDLLEGDWTNADG